MDASPARQTDAQPPPGQGQAAAPGADETQPAVDGATAPSDMPAATPIEVRDAPPEKP